MNSCHAKRNEAARAVYRLTLSVLSPLYCHCLSFDEQESGRKWGGRPSDIQLVCARRRTWLRRRLFVFTAITEMFRVSNTCIKAHAGRLDQSGYWRTFNRLITITFLVLATSQDVLAFLSLLFGTCEGRQVTQRRQDENNNTEVKFFFLGGMPFYLFFP